MKCLQDAVERLEFLAIGDITIQSSEIKHRIYPIINDARNISHDWYMKEETK